MDDAPRIGDLEVDGDALTGDGTTLSELADELACGVDDATTAEAPSDGWRVLRRLESGAVYLGSPVDADHRTWRLAQLHPGEQPPVVRVHPDTLVVRPSRAERRQGLVLRWPPFVEEISDPTQLVIDVVNLGHSRWSPEGDSFHAIGALTEPGEVTFGFAWMSSAQQRGVPLEPGEYARVPVHVQERATPTELREGPCDLHVVVVELGLRLAEPLRVELTAEMVARQVAKQNRHRADPASERRELDRHIGDERVRSDARRSWAAIADVVGSTMSENESLARIAAVLDCTTEQAASVYDSSLRAMGRMDADRRDEQLQELIRRRDALG
ncbi:MULTISPECIES: hypothetical protein [unclassified Plantibacter]|uniref:hypothetical protein n=1 Tax=unclassified Plantibacter TaxID=2624265 RepID=UPI00177B115A|nr:MULTISPECIES: hypothetical protein [unclassified Plantibacter]MBD8104693.1 hypothetical protein [Plantibacter sp. CFBP 8775]MBD8536036.1 hypothetical protein [Plantibacter sp. CFBP 13570]